VTATPRRGRRTQAERVPVHSATAARAACERIRRRRRVAHDPDLDFFPPDVLDVADVAGVVAYVERHLRVPDDVVRAELGDRMLLLSDLDQRAIEERERSLLRALDVAHRVQGAPTVFGPSAGLDYRQHAWITRKRLAERYRGEEPGRTAAEKARDDRVGTWLKERRRELHAFADFASEHRDVLLELLPVDRGRAELAEAIDQIGLTVSSTPTAAFAGAVSYAMFLLRADGPRCTPADSRLSEGLSQGAALRREFEAARAGPTP
jgi:hypothetical protein